MRHTHDAPLRVSERANNIEDFLREARNGPSPTPQSDNHGGMTVFDLMDAVTAAPPDGDGTDMRVGSRREERETR